MKKNLQHQKGFFSTQQKQEMNYSGHFHAVLFLLLAFLVPCTVNAQTIVTIGEGTTADIQCPIGTNHNYSFTEQLYTASQIGHSGHITRLAFQYRSGFAPPSPIEYPIVIYMKAVPTTVQNLAGANIEFSDADQVFSGTLTVTTTGWQTLVLDKTFLYDGTSNLLIAVNRDYMEPSQLGQSINGTWYSYCFFVTRLSTNLENCMSRHLNSDTNHVDITNLSSYTSLDWTNMYSQPNVQLTFLDNLPYVDDFETACDWELINGNLTNQWVWGEAGNRGDPHIYISNNNGTTNQYTITSPAMVYAAKQFHFEEGWYRFQYDWLANGEKNYDYLRVALVPASVTLSAGTSLPSGFSYQSLPSEWIALDGGHQLSKNAWWQTTFSEVYVPTGDYLMVFAWRNDTSIGTQPPAAIDNVSIRPVTCLAPVELTTRHVGSSKVSLDWTPVGNENEWEVWLSFYNGNETEYWPYPATTHPFTINGLTAGRNYTATVNAICGPDNASFSSNEISFTTSTDPCDNPATFPFTENFDGYEGATSGSVNVLPNCWSRINTTTVSSQQGYPTITEYSYAQSAPNFLYFMSSYIVGSYEDPQDQYAILPPMDHMANLELSLSARIPAQGRNGTFMVGVMTDPTDASTFTEIATLQPTSTTYTQYTVPLDLYMGDGWYIAIKMPAASSSVTYRGLCIDDVTVNYDPLTYVINADGVSVTVTGHVDGTNATGQLIIPETKTIDGVTYTVTAIGDHAFSNCEGLTGSLTIPNTVTTIGDWAFGWCTSLSGSLILGNSVTEIGNFAFNNCEGLIGSLTIPNTVTTIGNWAFANCQSLTGSLILGNSVTEIGDYAFINCNSLTGSLTIPNSVTAIGDNAFASCDSFTGSLTLGNSLTSIGSGAFQNCDGFTGSLTIPNSVTTIGSNAFYPCSGFTSLFLGNSVTEIGSWAFFGCMGLTTVTVLATMPPMLGEDVFQQVSKTIPVYVPCASLADYQAASGWSDFTNIQCDPNGVIVFADANVKAICVQYWDTNGDGELSYAEAAEVNTLNPNGTSNSSVFNGKSNLTSFNELQYFTGLTSIEPYAFSGCNRLASITLPNGITSINNYAFNLCRSLASITIPSSVTSIGSYAFQGCNVLTSITIPSSVRTIGTNPFLSCIALENITVEEGNPKYDSRDNCNAIISKSPYIEVVSGCKNTVIPSSVRIIGPYAFHGCPGLTTITIPSGVTNINLYAFSQCTNLTFVSIPSTVTTIGERAFNACASLTSITIPGSVSSISSRAFYGCTGLTSITVEATTPPTLGSYAFQNVPTTIPVYVPCNTKTTYQAALGWSSFTNYIDGCDPIVFADANVKAICVDNWDTNGDGELSYEEAAAVTTLNPSGEPYQSVFRGNATITSFDELQYFTGLTVIDDQAFASCVYLTSVTLPHTVTLIGWEAFAICFNLSSVTLPNSLTMIDGFAFNSARALEEIVLPSSLNSIGVRAFNDCLSLESVEIPASVTEIGSNPFTSCSSLTSITVAAGNAVYSAPDNNALVNTATQTLVTGLSTTVIPNTVTSIGAFAFYGCTGLTSITIPNSVTSIESDAFRNSGLTSITLEADMPPTVVSDAFYNVPTDIPVYVPCGSIEAYQAASGWNSFSNIQTLPQSLPYVYGFEWENEMGCWTMLDCHANTGLYGEDNISHTGDYCFWFYFNTTPPQFLISPKFEGTTGVDVSFYYMNASNSFPETFQVGYSTTTKSPDAFTWHDEVTANETTWMLYADYFPVGTKYVAVKHTSNDMLYLYLDDFCFTSAFCPPEDQCELTFALTDSYGDTWNGNAIRVVDVATGTILATMTNLINDHPNAPITEICTLAVCDGQEIRFEWVMGASPSFPSECSYTITDANGTVILQGTGSTDMNTGDVLGTYMVNCTQQYIFLTNGNWNDGSCWNTGTVPPAGSDVIIQANVTIPAGYLAVANEVNLDGGSITVADGGQLKHNTMDLVVTMKKNIAGYDDANSQNNYYLLAVPFLSVQVPAAMTANPGSDFYRFDPSETGAEWRNHKEEPITFVQRRYGYLYANPESVELSLTGITLSVSNEFTMNYTVDYTEGSSNPSNGWALLGNPFTYNAYVYRFDSNNEFVPMPIMMYDEEGELQTIYGGPVAPMQGFFVHVTETTTVYFSGTAPHEDDYVDLGLPSGLLWATCNVGANAPEEYGDYFAWGETTPKDTYDWSTYQYGDGSTFTKYTGSEGLTTLLPEDDAATANWGSGWRMPTRSEWQELYNNTTVTWTIQNGVSGRLFTAANGNSLFLPAAGYRFINGFVDAGSWGYFGSSSLDTSLPSIAWNFSFGSSGCSINSINRNYGLSVRPVRIGSQN